MLCHHLLVDEGRDLVALISLLQGLVVGFVLQKGVAGQLQQLHQFFPDGLHSAPIIRSLVPYRQIVLLILSKKIKINFIKEN